MQGAHHDRSFESVRPRAPRPPERPALQHDNRTEGGVMNPALWIAAGLLALVALFIAVGRF
ncbi:hypothetical protein [Kitasatospora sp. NPDC057223]|uniref:hypothetical protein n=1 Tax=Kitasatospora sp. NPDC057223 TaxID=3346055 RepID=UPI00362BDFF4